MNCNLYQAFVFVIAALSGVLVSGCGDGVHAPIWQTDATIPVTGKETTDSARIDAAISTLMKRWDIPGMTLAISKNGKLLYVRGYGYADKETQEKMQPDTRGRIGSVSKLLTGVALLHLVEEGKLDLDTPFVKILTQYPLPSNADPRLRTVTIRQVMHHTGGWDTSISGDVEIMSSEIAKSLGIPEPSNCGDWIRYKLGRKLDFDPGSRYSYSNFGYCLLSRVIETVSGQNYYDYVREHVLNSMDIHDVSTAYLLESQRQPRETKYYDYPGAESVSSILPPHKTSTAPYGWAQMEALEGMGGWIATAMDLTRFMNSLDGSRGVPLLSSGTMDQMLANPQLSGNPSSAWYGLGIMAGPSQGGLYWYHDGGCPGTVAYVAHRPDGYDWAIVINTRAHHAADMVNEILKSIDAEISGGVAIPDHDFYDDYPSKP